MRKKVLYIHHGIGIGGAPLSLLFLIQHLDREEYEPVVLCLHDREAAELFRKHNIKTIIDRRLSPVNIAIANWDNLLTMKGLLSFPRILAKIPLSVLATYRRVKEISPDIVHLNTLGLIPSAIGAKLAGAKVIWHIRETLMKGHLGLRAWLSRICIDKFSDKVIAIGECEANRLRRTSKTRVIYNFVPFERFDKDISGKPFRDEFNIAGDEKVVCTLTGVHRVDATMEFIKALKFVRQKMADVKFVIVGDYPDIGQRLGLKDRIAAIIYGASGEDYYKDILKFIKQEKLGDNIIFTGTRGDIPMIIVASDLVVYTSSIVGCGRPMQEAAAMAKPVVAFDLKGCDELVVNGITGILTPFGDAEKLAEAIVEILKDPGEAKKMGQAGYERARELFNAEVNAEKTFEIYKELTEG